MAKKSSAATAPSSSATAKLEAEVKFLNETVNALRAEVENRGKFIEHLATLLFRIQVFVTENPALSSFPKGKGKLLWVLRNPSVAFNFIQLLLNDILPLFVKQLKTGDNPEGNLLVKE